MQKKCKIIWSIQKKAVPLHPLLTKWHIVNDQMVNGLPLKAKFVHNKLHTILPLWLSW